MSKHGTNPLLSTIRLSTLALIAFIQGYTTLDYRFARRLLSIISLGDSNIGSGTWKSPLSLVNIPPFRSRDSVHYFI